jgi:predicted DNA binding protein
MGVLCTFWIYIIVAVDMKKFLYLLTYVEYTEVTVNQCFLYLSSVWLNADIYNGNIFFIQVYPSSSVLNTYEY